MILYLHGFRSGPESWKARSLGARMTAQGLGDAFWCAQLPVSARDTMALIEDQIRHCAAPPTLVGSSLGGYYATHLAEKHGLKAVLVNPSVLAPLSLSAYLGTQTHLYTGATFELTAQHIDELRALEPPALTHPERYWLLVETGDEVLDHRHALSRYAGCRQTVLEGGDHSFTRWDDYLDPIIEFAGLLSS
ncbi:YqiA/YcfP family alpha/beta fold hydrolase [Zoogloea sp.]|uniref:YqiA/YcfP family alpha/beta fold hydrolase n=1 Tax=Zoogloea sp. TaxID=49181 RepID=UPI002634159E|nr:YqiA/YcfP family alpha/beta fold hydrolase [Zoogloea sp.]MDD3354319.1 alpha/beta fold hydrolase [Zoogloea sp.]